MKIVNNLLKRGLFLPAVALSILARKKVTLMCGRDGGRGVEKEKKLESRTAENYILKRVKIFTNQFRKLHRSASIQ